MMYNRYLHRCTPKHSGVDAIIEHCWSEDTEYEAINCTVELNVPFVVSQSVQTVYNY
jgi:hypothetical protein